MGHREELDEALMAQFRDVSDGGDGQKKKESVETLKILYDLKMAQEKADQEADFKESEMALKEETAKAEAELEKAKFEAEQNQKEIDNRIRKSEALMKKLETGAKIGTGIIGMALYQKNFKALVANENTIHVIAQRPFMYLKGLERLAINGVRSIL